MAKTTVPQVCIHFLQDWSHFFVLRTFGRITSLSRIIWDMLFSHIHIPAQAHTNTWTEMNRTENITNRRSGSLSTLDTFRFHWNNWRRKYLHSEAYFLFIYLFDYILPSAFLYGHEVFFWSLLPDFTQLCTAKWRTDLVCMMKPRLRDCRTETDTDSPMFQYWLVHMTGLGLR